MQQHLRAAVRPDEQRVPGLDVGHHRAGDRRERHVPLRQYAEPTAEHALGEGGVTHLLERYHLPRHRGADRLGIPLAHAHRLGDCRAEQGA